MKKILICVRRLDRGGAEMLECRLATELAKLGMIVHLAGQYSEDVFDGVTSQRFWLSQGVDDVFFINSGDMFLFFKSWVGLYLKIKSNKYDVVITSNSGLDTYVSLLHRLLGFRHIIALHNYFVDPTILKSPRIKLWKYCISNIDKAYSITDFVNTSTCRHLCIRKEKNRTIYNAIKINEKESSSDIRNHFKIHKDSKIIVLAGRILPWKGFDIVLRHLNKYIASHNVHLIIVGGSDQGTGLEDGPVDYHQQLEQMVHKYGITDKVSFSGFRTDIFAVMQQCNVLVHLPRHEGFGLVLIEAIAAGLPIIASNVGGIPEVLKNTPYDTFDLDDQQAIQKEVDKYLNMPKDKLQRTTSQAKEILSYYSDERRAKEVKALIEEVCAE